VPDPVQAGIKNIALTAFNKADAQYLSKEQQTQNHLAGFG
jgi:23S rRNA maturation-related 3'-5' exoribonuclease YhaM